MKEQEEEFLEDSLVIYNTGSSQNWYLSKIHMAIKLTEAIFESNRWILWYSASIKASLRIVGNFHTQYITSAITLKGSLKNLKFQETSKFQVMHWKIMAIHRTIDKGNGKGCCTNQSD